MKEIKLTRGLVAIVDDEDYPALSRNKWHAILSHGRPYAVRTVYGEGKKRALLMQNQILPPQPGLENDHINRDSLDNRRSNLRPCTHAENCRNRNVQKRSGTGLKGVQRQKNRYNATMRVNGKLEWLGSFTDPLEAARAYDRAAIRFHGEFAKLNGV